MEEERRLQRERDIESEHRREQEQRELEDATARAQRAKEREANRLMEAERQRQKTLEQRRRQNAEVQMHLETTAASAEDIPEIESLEEVLDSSTITTESSETTSVASRLTSSQCEQACNVSREARSSQPIYRVVRVDTPRSNEGSSLHRSVDETRKTRGWQRAVAQHIQSSKHPQNLASRSGASVGGDVMARGSIAPM